MSITKTSEDCTSLRVGVVCDFQEEHWPSMDLVGDMLAHYLPLETGHPLRVARLCAPFRKRLTRLPILPQNMAWNADRWMNRFLDYPAWLGSQRDQHDLFHVVDHSYGQLIPALKGKPSVTTCHDLDTFRCLLEPERDPRPRWFRAMTQRILDGFLQSDHVVAVSAATRDELLRHRLFSSEQITHLPNAVHPSCSALPNGAADAAASELLSSGGPDPIWILSVGSTLPRKRLDILLRVFAAVRRELPQVKLLRAGGGFTPSQLQLAKELQVDQDIVILPFLEREVLAAIYRRATLLLQTSEAEGFGLPLIEAMACGCPVIASDLPVLREAGGTAARYCTVEDIDAWRDTVLATLSALREKESAHELRQAALDHAAGFSWAENAMQTANIYHKVLARRPSWRKETPALREITQSGSSR